MRNSNHWKKFYIITPVHAANVSYQQSGPVNISLSSVKQRARDNRLPVSKRVRNWALIKKASAHQQIVRRPAMAYRRSESLTFLESGLQFRRLRNIRLLSFLVFKANDGRIVDGADERAYHATEALIVVRDGFSFFCIPSKAV